MLNSHHVTGIAEVGGSFTYSRSKCGITLYFALKSHAHDISLLLKVQEFFKAGKIYKRGKGKNSWIYYRVNRLGDLIKIAGHFEKYPLLGAKQYTFEIWKQMIDCKRRKLPKDKQQILVLAQKLSERNKRRK